MNESVKTSGQETSFKEIFHEDYEIDESVNKVERSEEYTDTQLKIQSINQDYAKFLDVLKNAEGVENLGKLASIVGMLTMPVALTLKSSLEELLVADILFGVSVALTLLPLLFLTFYAGFYEQKKHKKDKEHSSLLKAARIQLLRSFFKGKILSNVTDLDNNWQTVEVLENGLVKSYMVRVLTDNNGLEFIESNEIVNN